MEHLKREIIAQIAILCEHQNKGHEICFHFVRNHALSIVQMSEEAMGPPRLALAARDGGEGDRRA